MVHSLERLPGEQPLVGEEVAVTDTGRLTGLVQAAQHGAGPKVITRLVNRVHHGIPGITGKRARAPRAWPSVKRSRGQVNV